MNYLYKLLIMGGPDSPATMDLLLASMRTHMPYLNISVVCPENLISLYREKVDTINENDLIDRSAFMKSYERPFHCTTRASWYYQQFLKYKYAFYTDTPEYIVWDADTIPLRRIPFKENQTYLFNRTREYHKPYFDTIKRLFRDIDVYNENNTGHSFISEYMIFNSETVREMLSALHNDYMETILSNIDQENIYGSGFSEYETYGTYMNNYYRDRFLNINLKTCRNGYKLFNKQVPNLSELQNANLDLDLISFESWDRE